MSRAPELRAPFMLKGLAADQEINVTLRRGYDIGIAQGWTTNSYTPRFNLS